MTNIEKRIEELEREIEELKARPVMPVILPMPYPMPVYPQYPYPQYPPWQPYITWTK